MTDPDTKLFDVVAVSIKTGEQRTLATRKTKENAEAFVDIAVMRRGLDEELFKAVPHVEADTASDQLRAEIQRN
jgi:hypothetical protein